MNSDFISKDKNMDSVDKDIFCNTAGSSHGRISAFIRQVPVHIVSDGDEDNSPETKSEFQSERISPGTNVTADTFPASQHDHDDVQNHSQALSSERIELNGEKGNKQITSECQSDKISVATTVTADVFPVSQHDLDGSQNRSQAISFEHINLEKTEMELEAFLEQTKHNFSDETCSENVDFKPEKKMETQKSKSYKIRKEPSLLRMAASEKNENESPTPLENIELKLTSEIDKLGKQESSISSHKMVISSIQNVATQKNPVDSISENSNMFLEAPTNLIEDYRPTSHASHNEDIPELTEDGFQNRQNVSVLFSETKDATALHGKSETRNHDYQLLNGPNAGPSTQVSANTSPPTNIKMRPYTASVHNCNHCVEKNRHIRFLQAQLLRMEANAKSESTENPQSPNFPSEDPAQESNHPLSEDTGITAEAPEVNKNRFREALQDLATIMKQKLHLVCHRRC